MAIGQVGFAKMTYDVAVIGGGMVGTAIAYGCAAGGARTAMLDQGDLSLRAARANAGLIYSQGKGEGLPAYSAWTRRSVGLWPDFAEIMASAAGREIGFRRRGVLAFCLGDEELEARRALLDAARAARVPVVDNDSYGELRYQGEPLPALKQLDDHG